MVKKPEPLNELETRTKTNCTPNWPRFTFRTSLGNLVLISLSSHFIYYISIHIYIYALSARLSLWPSVIKCRGGSLESALVLTTITITNQRACHWHCQLNWTAHRERWQKNIYTAPDYRRAGLKGHLDWLWKESGGEWFRDQGKWQRVTKHRRPCRGHILAAL